MKKLELIQNLKSEKDTKLSQTQDELEKTEIMIEFEDRK